MCRTLIMYANFLKLMQMVASKCKCRIHAVKKAAMSQLKTKLEKILGCFARTRKTEPSEIGKYKYLKGR